MYCNEGCACSACNVGGAMVHTQSALQAMWEDVHKVGGAHCKQSALQCGRYTKCTVGGRAQSALQCGRCTMCNVGGTQSAMWEVLWVGVSPAEINQRVSGRLAGLQSCNCLFFANIVVIVNIIVIIIVIIVIVVVVMIIIVVVIMITMNIRH